MNSVYSGYVVGLEEFLDISQGLKDKVHLELQEHYNELVLYTALSILDRACIENRRVGERGEVDEEFWARMVKFNFTCFYSPSKIIGELLLRGQGLKKLSKKYESRERLIKNMSYDYLSCIFELANNRVSNRILLQNVYRESSSKYNFSNELVLYPVGGGMLFLPNGDKVEKLLREGMITGAFDSYNVVCYGDYCVMDDREHQGKRIVWEDKSLSGLPVGAGMTLDLFQVTHTAVNDLEACLKDNLKTVLKDVTLPSRAERAERYAYNEVEERYIEWSLESLNHTKESFETFIWSDAGSEWRGLYEQLSEYYLGALQDLSMETLFDSLLDNMPSVKEALTLESMSDGL